MQSLTDLCLNKIEASGADTRELSEGAFPKRMRTRHPTLKIVGSHYFCTDDETIEADLTTEIEVMYTGVYILKCNICVKGDKPLLTDEEKKTVYSSLNMKGPLKFEQTFEELKGKLTPEQLDFIRNGGYVHSEVKPPRIRGTSKDDKQIISKRITTAENNIIAVEILRLLTKIGRAFFIDMFIKGAIELPCGHYETDDFEIFGYLDSKISTALLFIASHVSI